jgi:hypothetical protein
MSAKASALALSASVMLIARHSPASLMGEVLLLLLP